VPNLVHQRRVIGIRFKFSGIPSGKCGFRESSLAIAVELGIEVRNRELAERQRHLRHERDGLHRLLAVGLLLTTIASSAAYDARESPSKGESFL